MHKNFFFESSGPGQPITSNSSCFDGCVLTHALGEYPAGTEVGQIRVNWKACRISWRDDGQLIAFNMEAVQLAGS